MISECEECEWWSVERCGVLGRRGEEGGLE